MPRTYDARRNISSPNQIKNEPKTQCKKPRNQIKTQLKTKIITKNTKHKVKSVVNASHILLLSPYALSQC